MDGLVRGAPTPLVGFVVLDMASLGYRPLPPHRHGLRRTLAAVLIGAIESRLGKRNGQTPLYQPFAVAVWGVFSADLEEILLVHHRWRRWVPPGDAVKER